MIDRVHFENFKSLQHVTLHLGRLTALVGANGCGKSSVLQGMHLLSLTGVKSPTDRAAAEPWGRFASIYGDPQAAERLIHRGRAGTMVLGMRHSDGDELRVIYVPHDQGSDRSGFLVEVNPAPPLRCALPPLTPTEQPTRTTESWAHIQATLDHQRVQKFASTAYLRLDAGKMVHTTITEDEIPRMESEGSGLASALAWMKGAAEDELAQITADLRSVVPGVKRIKTYRERVANRRMEKMNIDGQPLWRPVDETAIGDRFAIEFDDAFEVPADSLSEGTVLALGLLAKLREPGRPRLFLLDDIDRGLHLGAQVKLVQVLRELMKLDSELQIVCTTHSPYLLDLFDPSEVRVLALDAERRTHARPLTEHPDFGKWKFGTQTGELWAALGEEWVLAGAAG
jgi:energy-coupling factor transporter ATP-binding protein EcfA2